MSRPLKVGLIGTGLISRAHLGAFSQFPEKVQLMAVCDVREEAVRGFAREARVDAVYTDTEKMLREADIDAVDICTSHHTHAPIAIAAAEAGKHVLLEKPMATSIEECRDIVAATDRAGVTFMVAQQLRHMPGYVAVRRLIQQGELGRIWGARSDSWLPVVMSRSAPPARHQAPEGQWRLDRKQAGGGSLIWNGTHFIDLLRYFIGDVRRVFGACWTDHPLFAGGSEDRVMATLEFENGAIGHLSNSWTARTPWMFQFMILGDEGTVYTPALPDAGAVAQHEAPAVVSSSRRDKEGEDPVIQFRRFVPVEPATEGVASGNAYTNEIVHFAECCQEGKEPTSSGRDNLGTMKVLFGIYESSGIGGPVDLDTL